MEGSLTRTALGQKRPYDAISNEPGPSYHTGFSSTPTGSSSAISFGSPAIIGELNRSLSPEREIALKKAKTEFIEPSDYETDVEIFVTDDVARPYGLNAEKRLASIGLSVRIIDVDLTKVQVALDKAKNNLVKFIIIIGLEHKERKTVDLHLLKSKGHFKFPNLSLDSVLTYLNITYQTSIEPKLKSSWIWRDGVKEGPIKQHNMPKGPKKKPIHPKLSGPINDLGVPSLQLGKREIEPEHKDWHQLGHLFQSNSQEGIQTNATKEQSHKNDKVIEKEKPNAPKLQPINSQNDGIVEIETTIQPETAIRGEAKILEFLKAQNRSFGLLVDDWKIKFLKESKVAKGHTLSLLVPDSDIKIIQEKLCGKLTIGTRHYFFKTAQGLLVEPVKLYKTNNRDSRRANKMIKSGILPPRHLHLKNSKPS